MLAFFSLSVFTALAEGSKELAANGGYRAHLLSSDISGEGIPFPTRGTVKVYARAGERIYLGSSVSGANKIRFRAPNGGRTGGNPNGQGIIANRSQEVAGPLPNVGGYTPFIITVGTNETGVWEIDFISPNPDMNPRPTGPGNVHPDEIEANGNWTQNNNVSYVAAFDVTVRNNVGTAFPGRAFMNIFGGTIGSFDGFNGKFHVLTNDGYIYEVTNNGQSGYIFSFFSNNKGFRDAGGNPIYKSINGSTNPPTHDPRQNDTATDFTHKLFFNSPALDLPETAPTPNSSTWLRTPLKTLSVTDVIFEGMEGTANQAGSYPLGGYIKFKTSEIGSYIITIDINKNGVFNDAVDVRLEGATQAGGVNSVYWDGRNGQGVKVVGNFNLQPNAINVSLRGGEVHFPFMDVEGNRGGIEIKRVNGSNDPDFTVYWDDSDFAGLANAPDPIKTAISGENSQTNGHKYGPPNTTSNSYGNNKSLDTWAYLVSSPEMPYLPINFKESDLEVVSLASHKTVYCLGEEMIYTIVVKNNGPNDVIGAKFFFDYPAEFNITDINPVFSSANSGNQIVSSNKGATQYTATLNLINQATLTYTFKVKLAVAPAGGVITKASIMRPVDVTDPDATNPDNLPPTNPDNECNSGTVGCNNIKQHSGITFTGVTINIGTNQSVTEGTGGVKTISFPVTLSASSLCDISVDYSISHLTSNNADFLGATSGTLVIPAGQTSANIVIQVGTDNVVERNEEFEITISNASGANTIDRKTAVGTILNDDKGIINVTKVDGYEEGPIAAKYIFSFANGVTSDCDLEIDYELSTNSARGNGLDYFGVETGTVVIAAGQSSVTLELPVFNDDIVEGNETIAIAKISSIRSVRPENGALQVGYDIELNPTVPIITIFDNDKATIRISDPVTLNEGDSGYTDFTFNITLDKETSGAFTLNFKTSDGTALISDNDYETQNLVVNFDGQPGTIPVIVKVLGDNKIESDEYFHITISDLSNNYNGNLSITQSASVGNIINDDSAILDITSVDATEGAAAGQFIFTLRDNKVADTDITITYTLTGKANGGGIDYDKAQTGTITLLKGQNVVRLYLNTFDDNLVEGTEDVILTVSSVSHPSVNLPVSTASLNIFDINSASITVADVQLTEGNAGTSILRFKAVLNGRTDTDFTLPFILQDISTTLGTDYTINTISPISFSPNLTTQEINIDVAVKGDYDIEGHETLQLILGAPSKLFNGNLVLQSGPATGTILDDDSGQITVTASHGKEQGEVPVVFTFAFPAGVTSTTATPINFSLAGSTASAGADYSAPTIYQVTIPANTNSITLAIDVEDDNVVEGTETIVLTPSPIIGNPSITINTFPVIAEIEDNDTGTISITGPLSVVEGDAGVNTTIQYTIKLSADIQNPLPVSFRTVDITALAGEDFDGVLNTYTFLPGPSNDREITVPVTIRGDRKIEADEVFRLLLNPLLSDFGGRIAISIPFVETTIENDDGADIVISKINGIEGSQDARFTIGFEDGYSTDVVINIPYTLSGTAQNPGDYTGPSSGVLTINPGQSMVQLDLPVVNDNLVENTETVSINLSNTTLPYSIAFTQQQETLDIIDNDAASVTISNAAVTEGNESDVYLVFDVSLSGADIQDAFTLPFSIADGTATLNQDYELPASANLHFNGPADRSKQIQVLVKGDLLIEKDETIHVLLGALSETFGGRLTVANAAATGTIINNDKGIIQIVPANGNEEGAIAGSFQFNFLNGVTSDEATTINFTLSGSAQIGADYSTAFPGSVTIPKGASSAVVNINVVDDVIIENTETVILTTTSVSSVYPTDISVANSPQTLNILDNDIGELLLTADPDVFEGADGETTTVKFKVKLTHATAAPFSVNYQFVDITATNGVDYIGTNDVLNFDGTAGQEHEVSVTIRGDYKIEDSESFRFVISNPSNVFNGSLTIPVNNAVFTIKDDDTAKLSINKQDGEEGGNDGYFTISLPAGYTLDKAVNISYSLGGKAVSGQDFNALPATITLPANTNAINIPIQIINDTKVEGDEDVILTANIITPVYGITFENNTSTLKITDNDYGTISINNVTVNEEHSGEHTLSFDVALDTETETAFNLVYSTENGTATAGEDYEAITNGIITFGGAKDESQRINVKYYGDKKIEADETFKVVLQSLSQTFNGHLAISPTANTGIATLNNDDVAVLAVAATNGSEGGTKGVFRFYLENGATVDKDITLTYTLGGSALNVSAKKDYEITHTASVTIPAGQNAVDVELTIVDDVIIEGTEAVELDNLQLFSDYSSAITLSPTIPVLHILDNDDAQITILAAEKLTEGNNGDTPYRFTVRLNAETAEGFTVNYTVADGTAQVSDGDYVINPTGILNFLGEAGEEKYIDVQVKGDHKIEPDESFVITLSNPSQTFENRLTIPVKTKTGIIENDDLADIIITKQDGAEGGQAAAFIFTLANNKTVDEDILIDYFLDNTSALAGTDFNVSHPSPLLLPKGSNSVTLTLNVVDDNVVEGVETVTIKAETKNNPRNKIVINNPVETLQIADNDEAQLSINNQSIVEGNDNTRVIEFTVNLDKPTQLPFSLKYSTADGTALAGEDYQAVSDGLISFNALSTDPQKISIIIKGDQKVEAHETFQLTLHSLDKNFDGRLRLPLNPATATIENDDSVLIKIAGSNGKEAGEEAGVFKFTLENGFISDQPIQIRYSLAGDAIGNGTDYYGPVSGLITIAANDTEATLIVPVKDDEILELNENIILNAVIENNPYPTGISLSANTHTIYIEDNDTATLTLSGLTTIQEENSGIKEITYTVTLDKATTSGFSLNYNTLDGTATTADQDYQASSGTLNFTGATAGQTRTFTVYVRGDQKIESDETFSIILNNLMSNFGSRLSIFNPQTEVTIKNDDNGNISITKQDGAEPGTNGRFIFSLPNGISADKDIEINYVLSGKATEGEDYKSVPGNIKLPAGSNRVELLIEVENDARVEGTETVIINATLQNTVHNIALQNTSSTLNIADDDFGTLSINNVSVIEQNNGSHTLNFNVSLDKATEDPFAVNYHTADGTATAGEDYVAVSNGVLNFSGTANEVRQIAITYKGDIKVEDDETFQVILSSLSETFGGHLAISSTAYTGTATLENDDTALVLVAAGNGSENGTNGVFKFHLQNGATADKPITINYTLDGTALLATAKKDYDITHPSTVTIPAGQNSVDVELTIVDDEIVEGTETVELTNVTLQSAYGNKITLSPNIPVLSIADNDEAKLLLSGPHSETEGDDGTKYIDFTLHLNKETAANFDVAYNTTDITASSIDGDYVAQSSVLRFLGEKDELKTIRIAVNGDHVIEPDETFALNLGNPTKTFENRLTIPVKTATGTIINDDLAAIIITKENGSENGQPAKFIFTLANNKTVDEDIFINYNLDNTSAIEGQDFTVSDASPLKLPKGSNSVTLTLNVNDDNIVEGTETVTITAHTQNNPRNEILISNSTETLEIADNDEAKLTISNAAVTETNANETDIQFTVSIDKPLQKPFTVKYSTTDDTAIGGEDFKVVTDGILSFDALSVVSKTITIKVNGDQKIEADEIFKVLLHSLSNNFGGYLQLPTTAAIGTIINDDAASITISGSNGKEAGEVPGTFTFSLPANVTSDQAIVISYNLHGDALGNGVDYHNALSGSLTIPANAPSATLNIQVKDDNVLETNETIVLNAVVTPQTSYTNRISLANTSHTIYIEDNDSATLTLSGASKVQEGNNGFTAVEYTLSLSNPVSAGFKVNYHIDELTASIADEDFQFTAGELHFTGAVAGESHAFTVYIKGDTKIEANETFRIVLTPQHTFNNRLQIVGAPLEVEITNDDNGLITITTEDGEERPDQAKPARFIFSLPDGVTADQDIILSYTLSNNSARGEGMDYSGNLNGNITISKNTNSAILELPIVDDSLVEDTETITIQMSNVALPYGITLAENSKTLNVFDNDEAHLSISNATVVEGNAGTSYLDFTVSLDKPVQESFTLNYHTQDITATAGEDYQQSSNSLTFNAQSTASKTIRIQVKPDLKIEADETLEVLLHSLNNNFGGRLHLPQKAALGAIVNDDSAVIKITGTNGKETAELPGTFRFSLQGNATSDQPILIEYQLTGTALANGIDYQNAQSGSITIPANTTNAVLNILVKDDNIVELNESVMLTARVATSTAYASAVSLPVNTQTIEIEDNDSATLSINGPQSIEEGQSGTKSLAFTLTLSQPVSEAFTVRYFSRNGTATVEDDDYQSVDGTLSFTGQSIGESYDINVAINGDTKIEGNEFLEILLDPLLQNYGGRLRVSGVPARGIIIDDDNETQNKTISIAKQDGEEGMSDASFTFSFPPGVSLDNDTEIFFSLDGKALRNADYEVLGSSSSIIIPAGSSSATLRLRVIDDVIIEGTEDVKIITGNIRNSKYQDIAMANPTASLNILDNDRGTVSISPASVLEGNTGTKDLIFNVVLSHETSEEVTLNFHTADFTATLADNDYVAVNNGALVLGPQVETRQIKITVNGDNNLEKDEILHLVLESLSHTFEGFLTLSNDVVNGTIVNDDATIVTVTKTDGEENGAAVRFKFSLPDGVFSDEPTEIAYQLGGSAIANGVDYVGNISGTVVIQPYQQAVELLLSVVDDVLIEGEETVTINPEVNSAYGNAITLHPAIPQAIIRDNDVAKLRISGPITVTEENVGTVAVNFTVSLDGNIGESFEVKYSTEDGSATVADNDYIPKTNSLIFSGTSGERQTITIYVNGDKNIESNENFFVRLHDLSKTFNGLLSIERSPAEAIILDDDNNPANKTITITKTNGSEAGTPVTFTFSFPPGVVSDTETIIPYSLSGSAIGNGVDYDGVISGEMIILPGHNSVTLTLPVKTDHITEGTETVKLTTGEVLNGNYSAFKVANSPVEAEIADINTAILRIADIEITEGDTGAQTAEFTVKLNGTTSKPFTLAYQTADGTATLADADYNASSGTLSFNGVEGEERKIKVLVNGDKKLEANETFKVILSNIISNFDGRLTLESTEATATIKNNDNLLITVTGTHGAEAGKIPARFIFSLPAGYTADIPTLINYTLSGQATAGGTDYTGDVNGVIAIPAGAENAILELPVIDDEIIEDDETIRININSINSNYPNNVSLNPALPTIKITDNDFTELRLSGNVQQAEENSGTTPFFYTITLEKATGTGFTLKYTTEDGTATLTDNDYMEAANTLSFSGNAGESHTIPVFVNGDQKIEGNEDFIFRIFDLEKTFNNRLSIPVNSAKGIIQNDDSSVITVAKVDGIEGTQDGKFVLSLAPGVTSDKDITINYRLSGTASNSDYQAQPSASAVIIPAGQNSTEIHIKVIDDYQLEERETVVLTVNNIVNPYNNVSMVLPIPVLYIYDNDITNLTISNPAPVVEGHNGTKTVTFTVTLENTTDKGFRVNYTTIDGTATLADNDYQQNSGILNFTGYAGETKNIKVTVNGDTQLENDETFGLRLSGLFPDFDGKLIIGIDGQCTIVNDDESPVVQDDMAITPEDTPITFSVIANDTHPEGVNPATVTIVSAPVKGSVEVNADGTVTYRPALNENGYDSFTYTVKDNFGRPSGTALVNITIIPVNDAPIANDDLYYVQRDSSIRENVALNDDDVDGDVLEYGIITQPKYGSLTLFDRADGTFIYVPTAGYKGEDSFQYQVYDPEGLRDTAEVKIFVQPKVRVSLSPFTGVIVEGDTISITAKLDDFIYQDVHVVLNFGGTAEVNKDYTLSGNYDVITIAAGDTATVQKFHIQSIRDYLKEGDETVEVAIIATDPSDFVTIGNGADIIIQDFYPEDKPIGPEENGEINPDPLMSPNGDGEGNEVFVIYNIERYPDNEVIIYNRWGNEVYRIKDYNNKDVSFGGKANTGMFANKGEDLVDGVYFFIIHTKNAQGKPMLNKGYVIMRR